MNTPLAVTVPIGMILPAIVLGGMALLVLLAEAFARESTVSSRNSLAAITVLGFAGAAVCAGVQWDNTLSDSAGMLTLDHFSIFLTIVFCAGGILCVLLSVHYLEQVGTGIGEYYALMLFSALGAFLMAAGQHLIMVFLGLEVLSVAIYPLAGFMRRDKRSNEAAIKYFLLGAFSSAFFLYGAALIYGATGLRYFTPGAAFPLALPLHATTGLAFLRFDTIAAYVAGQSGYSPIFWGGVALLVVSFCFKAALSPFHMWTPDAYDGAPTPISAYMGSVIKAAAFAPFFRFFLEVLGRRGGDVAAADVYARWVLVLTAIAILTMTWGNLAAVAEPSVKRMLAYSSVAHAGYIAVALISESYAALLFYTAAYTLMVVGSFGCAALVRRRDGEETQLFQEWTGIGLRYPWFGAAMGLFLFALAGFPPTAGFMGKFYVFRAALEIGAARGDNGYVALVAIALLNSLVSVYYYVRVVVAMYRPALDQAAEHEGVHVVHDRAAVAAIVLCAIGVIVLGIFPQLLFGILGRAYPI